MKNKFELLAPGGDIDSIKAAIVAGSDAVYCGLDKFNARNRATNIVYDDLKGILNLAHKHNCSVFLTLNIIILESEIPALIKLLNKLVNTRIDGVIVQDLGLFYLLSNYYKTLKIHASTQATTHNEGQVNFLKNFSVTRVNVSRELNISEIKDLAKIGHKNNILTEVFVHGSYCIGISGICYFSSVFGGNSGNRGRCSQPCRDRYLTTPIGYDYPLNLKDNSAYFDLKILSDAGVDSLKIEGRIKKFHYVYTVVNCWKKQILSFNNNDVSNSDNSDLYKVFNRDFSNSYLMGDINKKMFIDNPRDNSVKHFSDIMDCHDNQNMEQAKQELYDEKTEIIKNVKQKIKHLSIAKIPLTISLSGELNAPLNVSVKTPDISFVVTSEMNLLKTDKYTLDYNSIMKRFMVLNNTEYEINHLELENLQPDLFLSFKELTSIKNRILYLLNDSKKLIDPIDVPTLNKKKLFNTKPALSVLISSREDVHLCDTTSADIYFKLPNCMKNECSVFIDLFLKHENLIPWFPSILIGKNYTAAVEFLLRVQPKCIITNNTGIAYEAFKNKISWIAGPYLNITNSFSLLCLREKLNCSGAFISNEINKNQIKRIVNPDNFKLFYSIYHPILLLSSRQCLFRQTIGCEKDRIDEECLQTCQKSASIKNLKEKPLLIDKKRGNYHCMYHHHNFLNTDIIKDLPGYFSDVFIDLRDIKTETKIDRDKSKVIELFEDLINGNPDSENKLGQMIYPTTYNQYIKGL